MNIAPNNIHEKNKKIAPLNPKNLNIFPINKEENPRKGIKHKTLFKNFN